MESEPEGGGEGNSVAQVENGDGYGRAIHASRQSSRVKNPPGVNAMRLYKTINSASRKLIRGNQNLPSEELKHQRVVYHIKLLIR